MYSIIIILKYNTVHTLLNKKGIAFCFFGLKVIAWLYSQVKLSILKQNTEFEIKQRISNTVKA